MTGRRPRRTAALRLLFVWVALGQADQGIAQQNYGGQGYQGDAMSYDYGPPPADNCGNCNQCCSGPRLSGWVGVEYLRWRLDGSELPPLVTDGPDTTSINDAGQLDDPDTRILSGDQTVGDDWRNGYRLCAGILLDKCGELGLGADYFNVGDDDYDFRSESDASRIVTRPFFNTETNEDDAQLVSVPNELDGTAEVSADDNFQGAGVTLSKCIWTHCDPCSCSTDAAVKILGSCRSYKYDSNLSITENLTVLPGTTQPLVPGTTIFLEDDSKTSNEFFGGEIGLQGWSKWSWGWIDGLAKIAVGSHRRTVIIDGETINTVPVAGTAEFEGGLLTSDVTNIGHYRDTRLAVIPEFRLGVGGCVTSHSKVRAGYNLIIWPEVVRAASALPPGLAVDPRNLPHVQAGGGPEPEFPGFRGSTLVAHGFDLGITWSY